MVLYRVMSQTKSKVLPIGCIVSSIVAGVLVIGGGILFLFVVVMFLSVDPNEPVSPTIAHVDLEGIITSSQVSSWVGQSDSMVEKFTKKMEKVRKNDLIKAAVVRINTPGGEVTASDVLYHQIKKTAEKKPVVIYMDSSATSGGFYAACGGTEIMANPTTMTGSIGVIISTYKYSELFEKVGLESVVFTSGKFKDTLSGSREMREDEKKLIQDMVNQTYERFVGIVGEARKEIPEAKLRKSIADGRIISGADALKLKLIDSNGYIEDAYERARELAKSPKAKVIKLEGTPSFFSTISSAKARSMPEKVEVNLPGGLNTQLKPGGMYLLPPVFAP